MTVDYSLAIVRERVAIRRWRGGKVGVRVEGKAWVVSDLAAIFY